MRSSRHIPIPNLGPHPMLESLSSQTVIEHSLLLQPELAVSSSSTQEPQRGQHLWAMNQPDPPVVIFPFDCPNHWSQFRKRIQQYHGIGFPPKKLQYLLFTRDHCTKELYKVRTLTRANSRLFLAVEFEWKAKQMLRLPPPSLSLPFAA